MNSLVRTSTISPEPVTLQAMKNWLKVPNSADDTEISDLIQEARMQCELLSNSCLVRSTFVQYLDHFPHWRGRNEGYYPGGSGAAFSGEGGWGGTGYNRHHRHYGEIKIKRPPLVSVQKLVFIGQDGRPYTLNAGQDFIVDVASEPGRIRPIPYSVWPPTLDVPAAVAISFTAGYAPNSDSSAGATIAEPETENEALNSEWQPSTAQAQYSFIVDPNGNVEVQTNAGSPSTGAGPSPPSWPALVGGTIADGGCLWQNCGPVRGFWTPATQYAGQNAYVILDFNSNLQLLNVAALVSQATAPYNLQIVGISPLPWAAVVGGLTTDNGIIGAWRCLGPYNALGNTGLSLPNAPEQQAAVIVDRTLPRQVTRAIKTLVSHWYFNREPVTGGSVAKIPLHFEDMLGEVTVYDFAPTP